MTRRELFRTPLVALAGIPLFGNLFRPNPMSDIIRTLPFILFPMYKPGDSIFWYESPYWDVKLTGRVESLKFSGDYRYIVVRVDERSKRKLTDKTRFPMWAMYHEARRSNPKIANANPTIR